jgi:TonB family protein
MAVAVLAAGFSWPQSAIAGIDDLLKQADAAYRERDVGAYLEYMRAAYRMAPFDRVVVYNLACAYSLSGQADQAVMLLGKLAGWGAGWEAQNDSDFDPIRGTAAFRSLLRKIDLLRKPVATSHHAFTVTQPELLPSGIAYDAATRTYFLGSFRQRKIVAIDANGEARDFVPPARDGFLGGGGLAFDPTRRRLWAASTARPAALDVSAAQDGSSELFAFDELGAVVARATPPPGTAHAFEDIAVAPDGDIFVVDSRAGTVYRLRVADGQFTPVLPPGEFVVPRGIALADGGRRLFVAHAGGIAVVDVASGSRVPLSRPETLLLSDIESIVARGRDLVVIQPALRRILLLTLEEPGPRVVSVRTLEAHNALFAGVLGRGTIAGNAFVYIANSGRDAIGRDGGFTRTEQLQPPVVLAAEIGPESPFPAGSVAVAEVPAAGAASATTAAVPPLAPAAIVLTSPPPGAARPADAAAAAGLAIIEFDLDGRPVGATGALAAPEAIAASKVAPVFPPSARQARIGGSVIVRVAVDEDGGVTDVRTESEPARGKFGDAALKAVRNWKFRPATRDGQAVASLCRVRIDFRP